MDMSTNNATKKRVKHTTQRWFSVGRHLGFAADLVALLLLFAIIILSTVARRWLIIELLFRFFILD